MRNWKAKKVPDHYKVGIAIVTYNQTDCLSSLLYSLKAQTFTNFKAYTLHDGPWTTAASNSFDLAAAGDPRFVKLNSETRIAKFGHNLRQPGFDKAAEDKCDWICTMNGDCWYTPAYLEWMLGAAFQAKANFVYCNWVHSHGLWKPMRSEIRRGAIDAGNWIAHTDLVEDVKWDSHNFAADWEYIAKLKNKPNFKPTKVEGYIYTHN